MITLINKLAFTLVLFAYAVDIRHSINSPQTETNEPVTLEECFNLAKMSLAEFPASFLVIPKGVIKIEEDTEFPKNIYEGVIIQGTSRKIIDKNGNFSLHFDPAIGDRIGLRQLVQSLYANRGIIYQQKRICELLGEISRDYIGYKKNERGNKNYYVQIESKGDELFGTIIANPQTAYGALFKESGEWYFDEFKGGLHNLKLNQCLQSLIMQLEIIGDDGTKMISSQFKRKPIFEFLTQYAMELAKSKGFVVIINDRNFSVLETKYIQNYKPLIESNKNILVYTTGHPEDMKEGEEYEMSYYFVSNEASADLCEYLDLVKKRCARHKYQVAFLDRVQKLVTEKSRFYFKISRDGPYFKIVGCPTADAHGSCTIRGYSMSVNWFYDRPDDLHEIETAFILYYNQNRMDYVEPTIIHSRPYCMDKERAYEPIQCDQMDSTEPEEEPASKRRKSY